MAGDELDREAIRARCEAASPGQWEAREYRVHAFGSERIIAACWRPWGPVTGSGSIKADAVFIAHARTDVPALLDALAQAEAVDATTPEQDAAVVERAEAIMAAATDWFVQPNYGAEGLTALLAEGWRLVPPAAVLPPAGTAPSPEQDTPCCPTCCGDVEPIATGRDAGMFVCVTKGCQQYAQFINFDDLAWRA